MDHHRGRKAARGRLRGEELLEALAIGVEHRLGAAEIERHGHDLAADRLCVLAHIGVGDNQRLLDHGARAGGKETVQTAVERGAGNHRDQHGRNGGNNGEQPDDLHVQARGRVAAPARAHDRPYFAADDGEQEQTRRQVGQQELDDDFVNRRDRRQPGEHHEGRGRRQQRDTDSDCSDQAG